LTSSYPPIIISSINSVVDGEKMRLLVGPNCSEDGIREVVGAQTSNEEVSMVQPLVEWLGIPQTIYDNVHSPPNFDLRDIEGIQTFREMPQQSGEAKL
jgi:hypothetical protein